MDVLLLGGGLQGLSFGESLYRKCRVSVISDEYAIKKSRYFYKVFPPADSNRIELIRSVLSGQHFDVIVPMSDKYASLLSRHKFEFESSFSVKCAIPDYQTLSIVENKSSFMDFCQREDVPHPKTVSLSMETIDNAVYTVGFPALIKPDFSVGARGIVRVNSKEELIFHLLKIEKQYGPCSLQEYVYNPDYYYNVMMYRDAAGNCVNCVIIKILRMYPVQGGSSSYCISINDERLRQICLDTLDKMGWVGMADFDVLQKKDTGEYRIIEINPRVPASLRAAYVSGVNFPELIVDDALGNPLSAYIYQPGKALRFMGLDIMWVLNSPNRWKYLGSWLCFWRRGLYYQDIIASDVSTWYSWLVTGIRKFFIQR